MSAGTTDDLGTTGRQRMQTFNERTAQQAARAKEATRTIDQLVQAGVAPKTASQLLAESSDFTTSRAGVAIPQKLVAELAAEEAARAAEEAAPARQLSPLEQAQERQRLARASLQAQSVGQQVGALPPATVPAAPVQGSIPLPAATTRPSGLQQVDQMLAHMARTGLDSIIKPALAIAQKYAAPPLALAQGAGELVSAKQAMDQGDPLGAALRGLGGVGSIASMATPAALPVAIVAPLAQAFRERMAENRQQFPPDTRPLTPEEEEMASRPAFGFYRTFGRRPAMRR